MNNSCQAILTTLSVRLRKGRKAGEAVFLDNQYTLRFGDKKYCAYKKVKNKQRIA